MVSSIRKTTSNSPPGPIRKKRRPNNMPSRMSARARAALERTRRARAERDAIIAQADMREFRGIPRVVISGPPRKKVDWKKRSDYDVSDDLDLNRIPLSSERPPIAPPAPVEDLADLRPARSARRSVICSLCGASGHNRRSCEREPVRRAG
jgi:hypothetical protein